MPYNLKEVAKNLKDWLVDIDCARCGAPIVVRMC